MSNKTKMDHNGLEDDDEYYELSFLQSTDEGAIEVKPCTYALMTWWKVRMGNSDTIDISNESNNAILRYQSSISGSDEYELSISADETVDLDNILEVDEEEMLVSYFGYIPKDIPIELISNIESSIRDHNLETKYGYAEIYSIVDDENTINFLRFKASTYLDGIKVGKTNAVENLVNNAQYNLSLLLFKLCEHEDVKDWIFQ